MGKIEMESVCLSFKRCVNLIMGHRMEMQLNVNLHTCTLKVCFECMFKRYMDHEVNFMCWCVNFKFYWLFTFFCSYKFNLEETFVHRYIDEIMSGFLVQPCELKEGTELSFIFPENSKMEVCTSKLELLSVIFSLYFLLFILDILYNYVLWFTANRSHGWCFRGWIR